MKHHVLRALRIGAGILLICVGIVGIFVPFLQGLLLIFAGLVVLFGKAVVLAAVKKWKHRGMAFIGMRPKEEAP